MGRWLEFLDVDGEFLGEDTEGSDGWTISWNSAAVADGAHTLVAVATNAYAGGEIATIPISGGTITTGSSHKFDAVFVPALL